MNRALSRPARAVSTGRRPGCFSTGYVSPVSAASSTNRSRASSSRQSPGMMFPAARRTTSPGTTCSTGTSTSAPSRRTVAFTWTMASSLATASAAPFSCQKPRKPLTATMTRMMMASGASCQERRENGGKDEDEDDGALELVQEQDDGSPPLPLVRQVGAEAEEPRLRLGRGQSRPRSPERREQVRLVHGPERRAGVRGHIGLGRAHPTLEQFHPHLLMTTLRKAAGGAERPPRPRRIPCYRTSRLSSPSALRLSSMCLRMASAAFSGSGSTAKDAPTTSFSPSVSSLTTFMLPVIGGMGPSTV